MQDLSLHRSITSEKIIEIFSLEQFAAKPLAGNQIGAYFLKDYPTGILFKPAQTNSGVRVHQYRQLIRVLDQRETQSEHVPLKFCCEKLNTFKGDPILDVEPVEPTHLNIESSEVSRKSIQPFDICDSDSYKLRVTDLLALDMAGHPASLQLILSRMERLHLAPCFRFLGAFFRWRRSLYQMRLAILDWEINACEWILRVCFGRTLDSSEVETTLRGYSREKLHRLQEPSIKFQGHEVPLRPGASFLVFLILAFTILDVLGVEFSSNIFGNSVILGAAVILGLLFFNGPLPHVFRLIINHHIKERTTRIFKGVTPRCFLGLFF